MTSLLVNEEAALVRIQCGVRNKMARAEKKRLESEREEEKTWRVSLSRRRERIERLERELHLVEEMPAAQVDHYASTARYGRSNTAAAARTIQGIFRFMVKVKQRKMQKEKKREAAAKVLQRFARNAQMYREDQREGRGKKGGVGEEADSLTKAKKEEKDAAARRVADDMAAELPSVNRVAELQGMVLQRLGERKKERGFVKTQDHELRELAERAKTSMEGYRDGVTDARLAMISRYELRNETASLAASLWACPDLDAMMSDTRLQTSASGGAMVALPPAPKEYTALLQQIARNEHGDMLRALSGEE